MPVADGGVTSVIIKKESPRKSDVLMYCDELHWEIQGTSPSRNTLWFTKQNQSVALNKLNYL